MKSNTVSLPVDYLAHKYKNENGKKDIRYILAYSQEIAVNLAPMDRDTFAKMYHDVSVLCHYGMEFEHQLAAVNRLVPIAANLVNKGKAPALLLDFCQANANAVSCQEDFVSFCNHMEAVACYMK